MKHKDTLKSKTENNYELPMRINLRFGIGHTVLLLVLGIGCLALPYISGDNSKNDGLFTFLFVEYGCPLIGVFLLYVVIFQNIFKKSNIVIDENKIVFQLFRTKIIFWDDVLDISTYTLNHNEFLGFVTKQQIAKAEKGGFFRTLFSSMGGLYGGAIPLKQIHNLDRDETVLKIKGIFESRNAVNDISKEQNFEEQTPGSLYNAILYSSLFSIALGIVYALSIFILNINILLIPIFGVLGIHYYFIKYLKPEGSRLYFRLWTSFLGLISVFIARISLYYLSNKIFPTPSDLFDTIVGYFKYLPTNLDDEFVFVILGIVSAGCGFFIAGPSIPLFRKLTRPFMKRYGQLLYKKEEQYYTIYFIPPELYNEDSEKFVVRITQGCEIETERKKLKYFKLPIQFFIENEITYPIDCLSKSNDGNFIELSFGGNGNTVKYSYDCVMIANEKRELEVIELEIH